MLSLLVVDIVCFYCISPMLCSMALLGGMFYRLPYVLDVRAPFLNDIDDHVVCSFLFCVFVFVLMLFYVFFMCVCVLCYCFVVLL